MILKSLQLKNFKCFENYSVNFEKINLIEGAIGIGKSTLLQALVFAIYGYSEGILADLITRWNNATSCKVTAVIEENGHIIEVIREFPLKLTIKEDDKTLKMSTSEGNTYLVDKFGTRVNFSIFRVLDAYSKEANFLEEGTVTLKKILFAGTDEMFNNVRTNLNNIKLNRERYNRDTTVVYKCYPSEKRLQVLTTNLVDISNSLVDTENKVMETERDFNRISVGISKNIARQSEIKRKITEIDKQILLLKKDTTLIVEGKICFVCKQTLSETKTIDIAKEQESKIEKLEIEKSQLLEEDDQLIPEIEWLKNDLDKTSDVKQNFHALRTPLQTHKENIKSFIMKLEARLKQKEYIYTEKDVIVVKKAIEELDKLSSVYLVDTVRSLEPIINSVLEKIGFEVTFDVDIKGKFNILLGKEGVQYKYKDLSCGQRLILQIALKIALLLQQSKTGLMVSDEGLSALENDNLEDIINLFKDLQFQLIFVLHRASIEDPEVNIIKLGV